MFHHFRLAGTPQVTVNNAGAAPTATNVGGTQNATKGVEAPNTKTVGPATKYEGAVDQRAIKVQSQGAADNIAKGIVSEEEATRITEYLKNNAQTQIEYLSRTAQLHGNASLIPLDLQRKLAVDAHGIPQIAYRNTSIGNL